jgi:hypothetical protein
MNPEHSKMPEPDVTLHAAVISALGAKLMGAQWSADDVRAVMKAEGNLLLAMNEDPIYTAAWLFQGRDFKSVDQDIPLRQAYNDWKLDETSEWNRILREHEAGTVAGTGDLQVRPGLAAAI